MRHLTIVAPALAVALLAACGTADGGPTAQEPSTPQSSTSTTSGSPTSSPDPGEVEGRPSVGDHLPPGLRQQPEVAAALADAAARQNVPPERIEVAAWTPVSWNDGSLGCPEPGRGYTQAVVDGWLLLLRVDATLLAYHAGADGVFAYCADPQGTYTVRDA